MSADQGTSRRLVSLPFRAVRRLWQVATDAPWRESMRLRANPPEGLFQTANTTLPNRYPRIFGFVRNALGADSPVRVLSFGCSTGEEVFTLRRLLPRATIKGIDINRANIAVCRKRLRRMDDPGISFELGSSTEGEDAGSYDVIFCMAVLRRGELAEPGVTRCDHLLPFESFAAAVADFRRCLKPGGLLVIRHSNFRLSDTEEAAHFDTVLRVGYQEGGAGPIFGPDNRLMEGVRYPDTVFRKKGHGRDAAPQQLLD